MIKRRRTGWTGSFAALLFLSVTGISVQPAHANTYLFSFTTSQLMTALEASQGTSIYNESAYFAIFVQPDPVQISSYTYVSVTTPNGSDPNAWITNTITDPSSPNLGYSSGSPCTSNCTWAQFSKDPAQTQVTLVSGANGGPGGSNIFVGGDFYSFSDPPYGWGATDAVITTIMPTTDSFSFIISTAQALTGNYTLKGRASVITSGSPFAMTLDTKEDDGIPFTLSVEAQVPEPAGWILMLIGCVALAVSRRRRRRSDAPSKI